MKNKIVIPFAVVIVVGVGIFLPGIILKSGVKKSVGLIYDVPKEKYESSMGSLAENASEKLKFIEKMQIITGVWASTIKEIPENEMKCSMYSAVKTARDSMEKLYMNNAYDININTEYENWYSWDTRCYRAVENNFNTYSVKFWKISFTRYRGNEQHIVYMLEDGTVFFAYHNFGEDMVKNFENFNEVFRYLDEQIPIGYDENKSEKTVSGKFNENIFTYALIPYNLITIEE